MADQDARPSVSRIDLASEPDFKLGGMIIQPSGLAAMKDGVRSELQPRVMQVLVALAKARPNVVSRDQLIQQCWEGRIVGDDAINRCIVALRQLAREFDPAPFAVETVARIGYRLEEEAPARGAPPPGQAGRPKRRAAWIWGAIALALAAVLALAVFQPWRGETGSPTVYLTPAANDSASQALVRDLAVRLGSLPPVQLGAMRLVGEGRGSAENADLVLEVESGGGPDNVRAAVALRANGSRSILWSQSFQASEQGRLGEQTAYAAALALRCAAEAMVNPQRPSDQQLGAYVNACAALSDTGEDVRKIDQVMEGVVRASPRFAAGWARLLAAETDAITYVEQADGARLRPVMARHIAEARKIEPDLAEAYIAQFVLTPDAKFRERARLLELGVSRNPNHATARVFHSVFLISVGQVQEAEREARRAVELDPLSPSLRASYVMALAIRGRTDAARAELAAAERLWPNSTSLREARYAFHLRYDDPREALRIVRSGRVNSGGALLEKFLQARIDRSPVSIEAAVEQGRVYFNENPLAITFHAQTLAEFDRNEELIGLLLNWRRNDAVSYYVTDVLFRPAFAEAHRDPRFMRVAQRLGLLDYWRTTGNWPDFCYDPDLPYDCKAEAAMIVPGRN